MPQPSQNLVKAKLFSLDDRKYDIEFMFNPTMLDFQRSIRLSQPSGARSQRGQSKVNFAEPEPCVLTISNILFDTYEEGKDVLKEYIEPLIQTVRFLDSGAKSAKNPPPNQAPTSRFSQSTSQKAQNKRPPIFLFTWGSQNYLRCFVETFKYQLTLFLPDGVPVRATATLTLKEVDESVGPADPRSPEEAPRQTNGRPMQGFN